MTKRKRAKREDFAEWFRQQFGSLPPSPDDVKALTNRLANARWTVVTTENELARAERLEAQWQAALYADTRARKRDARRDGKRGGR